MKRQYKSGTVIIAFGAYITAYGIRILAVGINEIREGRKQEKMDKEFEVIVDKNFKSQ
jgi:hypothetical protein